MGFVNAEITMINSADSSICQRGLIKEQEIRSIKVQAVVDTGAMDLIIPEELRQKLGLLVKGETFARIANGQRVACKRTEAVEIWWKDRSSAVSALVIPGGEEVLMGVIPLENLDLIVNPNTQELEGAHGNQPLFRA